MHAGSYQLLILHDTVITAKVIIQNNILHNTSTTVLATFYRSQNIKLFNMLSMNLFGMFLTARQLHTMPAKNHRTRMASSLRLNTTTHLVFAKGNVLVYLHIVQGSEF